MRSFAFGCCLLISLSACSYHAQTSSGADYLARYQDRSIAAAETPSTNQHEPAVTDDEIRHAAAVEPILTFPGRFGLARIVDGDLTPIPADEAALWMEFARKHPNYGEFVPINPLIAAFAESAVVGYDKRSSDYRRSVGDIVSMIRLGAARQHVDAVLIYEVRTTSSYGRTLLAFTDFTIIGTALFPNRKAEAHGVAHALLLDVRNGYPYGSASAETDLSGLATTLGVDDKEDELRQQAPVKTVTKLVPEVEKMVNELILSLAQKRARPAPAIK